MKPECSSYGNETAAGNFSKDLLYLLRHPLQYFSGFNNSVHSFLIVFLGYYLVSFCEAASNGLIDAAGSPDHSTSVATVLLGTGLGSIIGSFISMLIYGILWYYLPVKLLKGKAQLEDTISSVGYAFFWPGILGTLTLSITTLSLFSDFDSMIRVSLYYTALAIQILAGIWALFNAGIAVKKLNDFGLAKVLVVLFWPIVLIMIFILGN